MARPPAHRREFISAQNGATLPHIAEPWSQAFQMTQRYSHLVQGAALPAHAAVDLKLSGKAAVTEGELKLLMTELMAVKVKPWRQKQIELWAQGMRERGEKVAVIWEAIAKELDVTPDTVRTYLRRFRKSQEK